jgi:hypothetical protein
MAKIIEVDGAAGVYRVVSESGQEMGVINGSGDEWYWQILGLDVVCERSYSEAETAILSEAAWLEQS